MFRLMAHPHKTTLVMHNLLCATYLKSAQENCLEIVEHGVKDSCVGLGKKVAPWSILQAWTNLELW